MLFRNYLKFNGLVSIIDRKSSDNDLNQIVIVDDSEDGITPTVIENNDFIRKAYIRYPINILYYLLIITFISWTCFYQVWMAYHNLELKYISANIFSYMFLAQYIFGIIFFRTKHFKKASGYMDPYRKYITIAVILNIIISLILSLIVIILLSVEINTNIYSTVYKKSNNTEKVFLTIGLFLNRFYCYNTFFANTTTFAAIFITQSLNIKSFSKKLKNLVNTNNDITIESIIKDYTEIKEFHTKSVNRLNNLFSTITILGTGACYCTLIYIKTTYTGVLTYFDAVCFMIIECIYIMSISRIKKSASDISDTVNSSKFTNIFLTKYKFEVINGDTYDDYTLQPSNGNLLPKFTKSFEELNQSKRMLFETVDRAKNIESSDKKINFVKELSLRNIITCNETAASIDWIIFNAKLNAQWSSFQIFGFQLNDSDLVKQLTGIVVGFLMISNVDKFFS